MTTEQPSRASAVAHALPRPRDEAHTIALRPWIPRSIFVLLLGNPVTKSALSAGRLRLQCRMEEDVFDLHWLGDEPLVVLKLEEALDVLSVSREAVGPGVGAAEEVSLGFQREAAPNQAREAGLVVVVGGHALGLRKGIDQVQGEPGLALQQLFAHGDEMVDGEVAVALEVGLLFAARVREEARDLAGALGERGRRLEGDQRIDSARGKLLREVFSARERLDLRAWRRFEGNGARVARHPDDVL